MSCVEKKIIIIMFFSIGFCSHFVSELVPIV